MAFGTASEIFTNTILDIFQGTVAMDFGTDTFKVALYGDTGTPDQAAVSASTCYNAGAWATANEKYDAAEWPQAGQALDSVAASVVSTYNVKFDAADEVSTGTSATLSAVMGCLVYDDTTTTPDDQGFSYHYFGGSQSVTDGTFTVVWNASGIALLTL